MALHPARDAADAPLRVDAHQHVWDLSVRAQPWTAGIAPLRRSFALGDVEPHLAAHRIDATVLVQTLPTPDETPELLALARTHPMVRGIVGWVDLTAPDVVDRLAELADERLVGIRHGVQDELDPQWLCRDDVRRGLRAVSAAGLTYDLLVKPAQLSAAVATVRAVPDLRFVLDHAGKPPVASGRTQPWQAALADLATAPNVAVKLSGLGSEAKADWTIDDLRPFGTAVLEAFGARRTMFGSDWPVCEAAGGYDAAIGAATQLSAACTPDERAAIFGGTARAWYGLR